MNKTVDVMFIIKGEPSFIMRSLKEKYERACISTEVITADVNMLESVAEMPKFFVSDAETLLINKEARIYLYDRCIESNRKLILIGDNSSLASLYDVTATNVIIESFVRPVDYEVIVDHTKNHIDEFEIQNGKLVYIGSTYTLKATKANIEIGEQLYLDDIALLTTAYAYYYQGNDIQYDMYTNRRSININPEAAADNNTIFLDCSSFVNSVYYNTYGKNILAGRKSNGVSDETPSTANFDTVATSATLSSRYGLVKYYDITKVTLGDTTTINSILTEVEGLLEVGDLINYRHGSAGHVMLYIGDNKFIHCTGSSYAVATGTKNFPNCVTNPFTIPDSATSYEKTNGAIQISDSSMLFSESGDRYLFKVDNNEFVNSNFCILRPLNRTYSSGSKVFTSLTTDALNRLSIPNVEMEKTSSIYNFKTVNTGEKITYTITFKNNNSYPINYVTINDTLSENVILDSWNRPYILDETTNVITFKNIVINANSTYQISYTVKVKSNLNPGTLIESIGYVNGIKLNTITNIVSGLSDSELTSLENTLKTKNIGSATNELDYINSLYDEQIFNTTSLSTVFEDLYKYDTETTLYSINESSVYYEYLVKTLYNGLSMKTDEYNFNINDRTRLLQYKYLEAGDIILTCTPATSSSTPTYVYTMYIYVNSNLILKVDGTTITTFTSSLGSSNSSSTTFNSTTYQFLERLTGCHRYMVLRPSIGL